LICCFVHQIDGNVESNAVHRFCILFDHFWRQQPKTCTQLVAEVNRFCRTWTQSNTDAIKNKSLPQVWWLVARFNRLMRCDSIANAVTKMNAQISNMIWLRRIVIILLFA
jgi:hypothetical protein